MDMRYRLLTLFDQLKLEQQSTLVAFAEFLCHRRGDGMTESVLEKPNIIPRPADESVPACLKRLKATYNMLDMSDLLGEASEIMSQHILQGRDAANVIDDMENLFMGYYQRYKAEQER